MYTTDALAGEPTSLPLWFTVPNQFTEIDLTEPIGQRMRRINEQAGVLPGTDVSQRANAVFAQEALLGQLARAGAVYAAHCIARSEHEPHRIVTGLFTVLVQEPPGLSEQSMATIARGLHEPGEPSETLLLDYPAGQAIVHGEQRLVTFNGGTQSMRQAQVIFRLPDLQRLAIFSMSTSDIDDWEDFAGILDGIARSVSFTPPSDPNSALRNALDGD
ncbi:hypothetical protein [Amycolatopsis suaedae]|uniref:Uncharacterized protein n=1 Tax=Amycolatopsis suaedae TaxID=2510978 RepID=A0A4Q7J759_9PSEU|nr:hypothetical protein [Amycolatopsis suaedae]RZQ62748.1 hypothetical protein EWH70_17505 [Amycolatopsis suaedae]